jgi:hypothetical protein
MYSKSFATVWVGDIRELIKTKLEVLKDLLGEHLGEQE